MIHNMILDLGNNLSSVPAKYVAATIIVLALVEIALIVYMTLRNNSNN